jgi:hypothetical protein
MAASGRFELPTLGIGGPAVSTTKATKWRPEQDSNPHRRIRSPSTGPSAWAKLERESGVEPDGEVVGNDLSHHALPHLLVGQERVELSPIGYQPIALPPVLQAINWSEWHGSNVRLPGSGPGCLPLTYTPKVVGTEGIEPSLSCSQGKWSANDPHPELEVRAGVSPA